MQAARSCLDAHGVRASNVRMHRQRTDRSWLRDSAPTGVHDANGDLVWLDWAFNAWAKYDNFADDVHVGECVARITRATRVEPQRDNGDGGIVLEGGGIETDGQGTMLVTEEWLLSDQQVRNPGFARDDYERAGVREYVVVALRQQEVYWFVLRNGRYVDFSPGADGLLRSEVFPGLWLDPAALLRRDANRLSEILRLGLATAEHAAFVARLESARFPRETSS